MNNESNDLESWLWGAACSIRGEIDAPKFKDFILPIAYHILYLYCHITYFITF